VEVRAVAARDAARARRFAARHRIPRWLSDYEALIQDPQIDAVYIPLPNSLHAEWSIRALRAGKHVLCEKPLASNADEAIRMAAAARDTGRTLMEAFHYRYHPFVARLKAILDSGELGAIRDMEAHFHVPLLSPRDIRYRYDLAGGATMDLGCYTINLIRFLAGAEPRVVSARARLASPQIDRWMEARFRFASGLEARMTCAIRSLWLVRSSARVVGDRGELRVLGPYHPHLLQRLKIRAPSGRRLERVPGDSTFTYQLRAFVKAVRDGEPLITDPTEAVANLRVIDAVYERAGLKIRGLVL
jgi:predicted dehydrogenase